MNTKLRTITVMICMVALHSKAQCGEREVHRPLDETAMRRAQLLAEFGDIGSALKTTLQLLRQGDDEELREGARHHLRSWGLTPQEMLQLDLDALKPEEKKALLVKLGKRILQQRRHRISLETAFRLLRLSVAPILAGEGTVQLEVNPRELTRALNLLIEVALAEGEGHPPREARRVLERMRIVGARLKAVQKACKEGQLARDLQRELVVRVCIHQLRDYARWQEGEEEREAHHHEEGQEHVIRRRMAQKLGVGLYRYLRAHFADTKAFSERHEALEHWRAVAGADTKARSGQRKVDDF